MVGIGLILICNDYYFFWPPFAAKALNDDLTGGLFVFVGIWLLKWAVDNKNSIAVNRGLLIASAGLLGGEACAEFTHAYVSGQPHMFMAGFLVVILLLFVFSIISKSAKHKEEI